MIRSTTDQWGVDLGKTPAARIVPEFKTGAEIRLNHDSSATTLV